MKAHNKIPPHACRHAAFDGKQPKAGERVIELPVNVEDLPMQGSICLLERHVRQAMRKLDIAELDADAQAEILVLRQQVEELTSIAAKFRVVVDAVAELDALADV